MIDRELRTVAALAAREAARRRDQEALTALHEAIVADLDDGVTQAELVRITGYTRERIRQITKAIRGARRDPDGQDT